MFRRGKPPFVWNSMYMVGSLLRDQRGWHPGGVSAIGKILIVGRGGAAKLQATGAVLSGSHYGNIHDRDDIYQKYQGAMAETKSA